ncbi:MAG: hypothetical protein VX642_11210 [Bdellovibrionota bacterium]|nr:hypothetical protein [Bdellovibrionota bacterium]
MKKTNKIVMALSLLMLLACEKPMLTEYVIMNVSGVVSVQSPMETQFNACLEAIILVSSKEDPLEMPIKKNIEVCELTEINRDGSFDLSISESFKIEEGKEYRVVNFYLKNMSTKVYETDTPGVFRKNRYYESKVHKFELKQSGKLTTLDTEVNFLENGHTLLRKVDKIDFSGKLLGATEYEREGRICFKLSRFANFSSFQYELKQIGGQICAKKPLSIGAEGNFSQKLYHDVFIPMESDNLASEVSIVTNPYNDGILNLDLMREKTYSSTSELQQVVAGSEIQLAGKFVLEKEGILSTKPTDGEISKACVLLGSQAALAQCMENRVPPAVARNCARLISSDEQDCIKSYLRGR